MNYPKFYEYHHKDYKLQIFLNANIKIKLFTYYEGNTIIFIGQISSHHIPQDLIPFYPSLQLFFQLFSKQQNLKVYPKIGKFVLSTQNSKYLFCLQQSLSFYKKTQSNMKNSQTSIIYEEKQRLEKKLRDLDQKIIEKEKIYKLLSWHSHNQEHEQNGSENNDKLLDKFQIEESVTTYIGNDYEWRQIILKKQIPKTSKHRFSCKILKTRARRIFIGVADFRTQKNEKYSHHSGNAICYWGLNGRIWYGNIGQGQFKDEGNGFEQGDIVTVQVNIQEGIIIWFVNKILCATIKANILRDTHKKFVPFADFFNNQDSIQWIQHSQI